VACSGSFNDGPAQADFSGIARIDVTTPGAPRFEAFDAAGTLVGDALVGGGATVGAGDAYYFVSNPAGFTGNDTVWQLDPTAPAPAPVSLTTGPAFSLSVFADADRELLFTHRAPASGTAQTRIWQADGVASPAQVDAVTWQEALPPRGQVALP